VAHREEKESRVSSNTETTLVPVTFVRDVGEPFKSYTQNKLWRSEDGSLVVTSYVPPQDEEPGETMVMPACEDGSPDLHTVFKDGPFGEYFDEDRWVFGEEPQHTEALATMGYVPAEAVSE
jgi:hypothetical protein